MFELFKSALYIILATYIFMGATEFTLRGYRHHKDKIWLTGIMFSILALISLKLFFSAHILLMVASAFQDVPINLFELSIIEIVSFLAGFVIYAHHPVPIRKIVRWIHRNKKK